jgi:hypothetical protein
MAARHGEKEVVALLLGAGAEVNGYHKASPPFSPAMRACGPQDGAHYRHHSGWLHRERTREG